MKIIFVCIFFKEAVSTPTNCNGLTQSTCENISANCLWNGYSCSYNPNGCSIANVSQTTCGVAGQTNSVWCYLGNNNTYASCGMSTSCSCATANVCKLGGYNFGGTNSSNCTICSSNQVSNNNTCVNCPKGATAQNNTCICPPTTGQCIGNSGNTLACITPAANSGIIIPNPGDTCTCQPGYYLSNNNVCVQCGANQISTGTPLNKCLDCPTGTTVSNNTCTCPAGSILSNNVCTPCKTNQISNANSCFTCPSGSTVQNNTCVCTTAGYVFANNTCAPCASGMVAQGNQCVSCPQGAKVSNNQCVFVQNNGVQSVITVPQETFSFQCPNSQTANYFARIALSITAGTVYDFAIRLPGYFLLAGGDGTKLKINGTSFTSNAGIVAPLGGMINFFDSNLTFSGWVDTNMNYYRFDCSNQNLYIGSPKSVLTSIVDSNIANQKQNVKMIIDTKGNIYYVNNGNKTVMKMTVAKNANLTNVQFNTPTLIGSNTAGTANGQGGFVTPWAIASDASNNIYVADAGAHVIQKWTASSQTWSIVAGTRGTSGYTGDSGAATAATLNGPNGVAVDTNGNIMIADTGNKQLRVVWASNGQISTIPYSFTQPNMVKADANNNIYVMDVISTTLTNIIKFSTCSG